jgi:molecular chaperone GrpE (heat shock protein)
MSRHPLDRFGLFAPWERLDPWSRPRRGPRSEPRPEPPSPKPGRSVPTRRQAVWPGPSSDERQPPIGDERPPARPVRIVRDLERIDDPRGRAPAESPPIGPVETSMPGESHERGTAHQPIESPCPLDETVPSQVDEVARARLRLERDADRQVELERRELLSDFIEVLDDLDRALAAGDDGDVTEGVRLVRRRFLDKLARHGARRVGIAVGDAFDAASQEAIATVDAGPERHGRVVEVLRPAYFVGDELLRPGQVVVGR